MGGVAYNVVTTKIPARMDRLPWTRWHWFIVFSLGIVWILDGLEVTIKGAVGPSLRESLGFTTVGVAGTASIYLIGAVSGALFWGYLTDKFGRRKLFIITIAVYMLGVIGTSMTGLFPFTGEGYEYVWFATFRFITGFGIGGEYAAINSTIDELMPARVRGRVALIINGSYWVGTAIGAVLGAVYLNIFDQDVAFRIAFGMGGLLAFAILLMRFYVPESPRWLVTHGRSEEAEETVQAIERDVSSHLPEGETLPEPPDEDAMELRERESIGFISLGRTLFKLYPSRSFVGATLLLTQAFLYNAIFFTFGLMLVTFFDVPSADVGWFLIPFAVGNFMGPVVLGPLFDTRGRKVMIPLTFITSAVLTATAGLLFASGVIGEAWIMTLAWVLIFFFASAAASSGYLTVSETFPLEVRAMAISFFYALGTFIGGVFGPILFGTLISGEDRWTVFYGYLFASVLMVFGGLVHRKWGVEAAQRGLESIAMPLSVEEAEASGEGGRRSLDGPGGVDLADRNAIRQFQRENDLKADGLIGPATAAALRASGDGERGTASVDVTDPEAIKRFQADHGLEADGIVGDATRGALLATEHRGIVDPADAESIRRFQRTHGMREDGVIGESTMAALRSVLAEQTGNPSSYVDLDPLDRESICDFQKACGLRADGNIGPMTRGALKAERARRARCGGVDIADPESVKRFQREQGDQADGVIGERTQEALRKLRESRDPLRDGILDRTLFGVDPADEAGIARFQREVGIDDDGCIGPETRWALRRNPHLLLPVDPTDRRSIEQFQADHGLKADGVIGTETQGALRSIETELRERGAGEEGDQFKDREAPKAGGLLAFDAADAEAVRKFQRDHGLQADGEIGPATQAALRAAFADSEQEMLRRPVARREGPRLTRTRSGRFQRAGFSPLHLPSYSGGEDRELEREVTDIVEALQRRGTLSRKQLAQELNTKLWGPGRLKQALAVSEEENLVRKVGRDRYAPV